MTGGSDEEHPTHDDRITAALGMLDQSEAFAVITLKPEDAVDDENRGATAFSIAHDVSEEQAMVTDLQMLGLHIDEVTRKLDAASAQKVTPQTIMDEVEMFTTRGSQ